MVWRGPSVPSLVLWSPTIISKFDELSVQWAAVNTCRSLIRVPPQKGLLPPRDTRATCQGKEYGVTSAPPTIPEGLTPHALATKILHIFALKLLQIYFRNYM